MNLITFLKNKIWILLTLILAITLVVVVLQKQEPSSISVSNKEIAEQKTEETTKELPENCPCGCEMKLETCTCSTAQALKGFQEKQKEEVSEIYAVSKADHIRGEKSAPITLIEYSDFQCPFCKKFHPTMKKILQEFKGKVRWVYRHFPLSFHKNARISAQASECAGEQGKFWEYADRLFEEAQPDGRGLEKDDLIRYAQELGLKINLFKTCLEEERYSQKIDNDMDMGEKSGVTGTPGTILIDARGDVQLIKGAISYNQLKRKIEEALRR